jgi:4-hydroxy-tetrahydrodipicolinate synthase
MGLPVGQPRPPRLPLPADDAGQLRVDLDQLGLLDSIPSSLPSSTQGRP